MFTSDIFDFSPVAPEKFIDVAFDFLTDALLHKFESNSIADANGYAVLRAVRWMVVGFAAACLGAFALGVAIGGLILAVWRWGFQQVAVGSASTDAVLTTVKGWGVSLQAFVTRLYGAVSGWAVKELG